MSGLFKSIGKIFKKVAPVLKKIVLPALAIAAVVVTGGAALGLLPGIASLGGLAASLGATGILPGILTAAGTGATIGMLGGLVTTGSLKGAIKGASMGLVTGAVTGGISGALGGGLTAATGAQTGAATAAGGTGVSSVADLATVNSAIPDVAGHFMEATGSIGQAASGIGGVGGIGQAVAAGAGGSGGGGILGFLSKNPMLASGLMKGIGSALQGNPQAQEYARRRKSYEGVNAYSPYQVGSIDGLQDAGERFNTVVYGNGMYDYDPATGRVLPKRS